VHVDTLSVTDLMTGQVRQLLTAAQGLIPASLATTRDGAWAYAWALNCAGFARSSCGGDLFRLSLQDGSRALLLRTLQPGAIAVTDDGRKLAVSTPDGVVVRELAP
jgi:hypothetical protein